jgi:meiotically up-regulated gene 157 (Mug157) protein
MAVELKRAAGVLRKAGKSVLAQSLEKRSQEIVDGIWEYGVVSHKKYGNVFAYEVDGYGSHIMMDDANIPSLLALPLLGFVNISDKTYQNTRRMILEKNGNPYYLQGKKFKGIGGLSRVVVTIAMLSNYLIGPHVGLEHAWPMSILVQAMTTDDDEEIKASLNLVLRSARLGLVHESINVKKITDYTRRSHFNMIFSAQVNLNRELVCM